MAEHRRRCSYDCCRPWSRSRPKDSTLVLPFPVELLRFLERATPGAPPAPPISSTASQNGHELDAVAEDIVPTVRIEGEPR